MHDIKVNEMMINGTLERAVFLFFISCNDRVNQPRRTPFMIIESV